MRLRFVTPRNRRRSAPAACRSRRAPPCAAPRRASADLVAERYDAAICLGRSGSARLALETARSIALALATEGPLNLLSLGHVFGFFSLSWKQSLLGTSRFLLLSRTPQSLEAVAGGVTLALVLAPFGAAKSIPSSRRGLRIVRPSGSSLIVAWDRGGYSPVWPSDRTVLPPIPALTASCAVLPGVHIPANVGYRMG